jgi:hypothetical protein
MHRQLDEEIILKNLDRLEEEASLIKLTNYEPTLEEINKVRDEILMFVKDKKRIIYGGYAQNSLILSKNKKDAFYKETDLADIEFYSPDPIGDTIDLCDRLKTKGFKYVEGKEGVHQETYKIFSNFINYCDITYMPHNIFNNCPTIDVFGARMCHPHLMLIDAYRVYTDPMTSYFRLKKTFTRFNTLMKYYPLDDKMLYNKIEQTASNYKHKEEILKYIRRNVLMASDLKKHLIVVGHYAFNQLIKKAKAPGSYLVDETYYQVISTDYGNDLNKIMNALKKKYNVTTKKYYPFYQYLDKSTEFYINGELVLRVYGSNERCITYRYSKKKHTNFGTYQLIFMYNLINYNIAIINASNASNASRNNNNASNASRSNNAFNALHSNINLYGAMLVRMIKAQEKYLTDNSLNVLDKSPFQEFTFKCIGEPKDILRESFLQKKKKRDAGKKIQFTYTPSDKPGKKPDFRFDNTSGELIR